MTRRPVAWAVRIEFADGTEYTNRVHTDSSARAFHLALIDSRMGSPHGSFHSPVVTWNAVLAEEVAA